MGRDAKKGREVNMVKNNVTFYFFKFFTDRYWKIVNNCVLIEGNSIKFSDVIIMQLISHIA